MSQLRIYVDGKPNWLPQGPARARPAGYGGQALGSVVAPTLVAAKPKVRLPRQAVMRDGPICGVRMPGWRNQFGSSPVGGDVCARTPGHLREHRSAYTMDNAARRRRAR
jgi:hypothetical protein